MSEGKFINKSVIEWAAAILRPLTKKLARAGISPNSLTWTGALLALISGVMLAQGRWGWGTASLLASGLMDTLDGLVARESGRSSRSGAILDSCVDRYSDFFILAGLAYFFRQKPSLFILCLLALLGSFLVSYTAAKSEAVNFEGPPTFMKRQERWVILIVSGILSVCMKSPMPWEIGVSIVAVFSNISALRRLIKLINL